MIFEGKLQLSTTSIIIICQVSSTLLLQGTMFQVTQNITLSSWDMAVTKTSKSSSLINCASQCVFWEKNMGSCNSFRYEKKDDVCKMAKVRRRNDPYNMYRTDALGYLSRRHLTRCWGAGDGVSHCC
jgi:hypothetical protein